MMSVKKNNFDFSVPLTKEEIQAAQLGKEKKEKFDLGGLLARNQGLVPHAGGQQAPDSTPIINGYKMLKETPLVLGKNSKEEDPALFKSKGFRLPQTPSREELGH